MKYLEYMQEHENDNFSWCKPYANASGDYMLVMCDGELSSIKSPTFEAFRYDGTLTDDVLERFAREVNPDYDLYSGWSDLHIALEAMHEVGCSSCPWREDCEPMGEEMSETDYR